MHTTDMELLYEISMRDVKNPKGIKQHANSVVRELQEHLGQDADIQVHIEPESKSKGLYAVSLVTDHQGESVVVRKTGRKILGLLKSAKRTALRVFRRAMDKQQRGRKFHRKGVAA